MTILQWNCRGYRANSSEFLPLLYDLGLAYAGLQESMLGQFVPRPPSGYSVLTHSQAVRGAPGDGLMCFISNDRAFQRIALQTPLQAVAVRLQLHRLLTVCNIYVPPRYPLSIYDLVQLSRQLPPPYLIIGDFNARNQIWEDTITNQHGDIVEQFLGTRKRPNPWWTPACTLANLERKRALRRFQRSGLVADKIAFSRARTRALARKVKKDDRSTSWRRYVSRINSDTTQSKVWNRIKKMSGRYRPQPSLFLVHNGGPVSEPRACAELIADHFASVSSRDRHTPAFRQHRDRMEAHPLDFSTSDTQTYNDPITMTEVKEQLIQEEGVPQGSVFSCTLFALAINNILRQLPTAVSGSLYVDDLVIYASSAYLPALERRLQVAINALCKWCTKNGFTFSPTKTVAINFHRTRNMAEPSLNLANHPISFVQSTRFLGVVLDSRLSWIPHIRQLKQTCIHALSVLRCLSHLTWGADRCTLLRVYRSLIRSKMDYGSIVFSSAKASALHLLNPVHNSAIRLCTGAFRSSPLLSLYAESGEFPLSARRDLLMLQYLARAQQLPNSPSYLSITHQWHMGARRASETFGSRARDICARLHLTVQTIPIDFCNNPRWLLSPSLITGNEAADELSRLAAAEETPPWNDEVPHRDHYPIFRRKLLDEWQGQWTRMEDNKLRKIKDSVRPWPSSSHRVRRVE
ncbi:hypothetical protein HAZT_HAZT007569, partial [Hyalella azteca]